MADNPFAGFPAQPRDVAEWEDLLIRFEIAPRALRHTLESARGGIDVPDPSLRRVADQLRHLAEREAEAWQWMQALREGGKLRVWAGGPRPDATAADRPLRDDLDRFTSFRSRNFAWVQRRGVDVWGWSASHEKFGEVTPFRLISYLVRHDGHHLARIRDAFRAADAC
jgi:hypothetical protein